MLSRAISDGVTFASWFTPAKPVRNAVTRSLRGKLLGAMFAMFVPSVWFTASRNSTSSSAGNVGLVTYVRELAVVLRLAGVEAILVGQADHQLVDQRHRQARHLHPTRRRRLPGARTSAAD